VRRVATVAEVRAADRAASALIGEAALIARASAGLAATVGRQLTRVYGARVTVLAGSGHNGADALRAGALLAGRGAVVRVVRCSDREPDAHGADALAAVLRAGGRLVADPPTRADVVLDGMVGVGGRAGLRERAAALAAHPSRAHALVVAVDLPSGVDADTGAAGDAAVRADLTVTFDAVKPGLLLRAGRELAGSVQVVEVGLGLAGAPGPLAVLEPADVAALLPDPAPGSDKYSRGVVGVVAGSDGYPGAGELSTGGAVRTGAGYVRYLAGAVEGVQARFPSVVAGEGRCDAYVVGSGLGTDDAAQARVRELLATDVPLVLDADGLAVGADAVRGRAAPTLITPHAGEFRRLTGVDPSGDPLAAALAAARDLGVTVLLKGGQTVVAAPDGTARIVDGCPWLSTAGTGDVLGGICAALLALLAKRGHAPATVALDAGAAGASLHVRAAWLAADGAALAADALLPALPEAARSLRWRA